MREVRQASDDSRCAANAPGGEQSCSLTRHFALRRARLIHSFRFEHPVAERACYGGRVHVQSGYFYSFGCSRNHHTQAFRFRSIRERSACTWVEVAMENRVGI